MKKLLIIVVATLLTLWLASLLYFKLYFQSADLTLAEIEVYDLQDQQVDLHMLVDKPTVVNFWSSWCRPCLKEFPYFEAQQQVYGSDINFIMISDEPLAKILQFAGRQPYKFTYLRTPVPFKDYGINIRPTSYFFTKDGKLMAKHTGRVNAENLAEFIEQIK